MSRSELHSRLMSRLLGPLLAVLLGLTLLGCPRTPDAPEPLDGTPCEQNLQCNAGATCGRLRLCVDGFCEEGEGSLIRPCEGVGTPVRPPEP